MFSFSFSFLQCREKRQSKSAQLCQQSESKFCRLVGQLAHDASGGRPKTDEEASIVVVAGSRWSKPGEFLNAKPRPVRSLCGSSGCEPPLVSSLAVPDPTQYTPTRASR